MAEPASAASAAATIAGAVVLSTLGIEPGPLFWALVGACLGMSLAGPATRARACLVFVCVVLACSLFGAATAVSWFGGAPIARNAFACLFAIGFHPALNAGIAKIPEAIDGVLRLARLKQ